ncbi:VOC family protein [Granulicella tundricola]|uniref:Methylmalonyl-CoA epimerase n=1 Tax=Granulicella tundricola (strain ATCC BAA-1859 / DSM 23138 / MP5ACTX9) TaxID=1198114 RepID=E8X026_GRATM|nr:VOC family protein [Granulicella tundricola]ADW68922.1 methylmalonyl-CoA epimerase [Granulicella tundricola MP5ACTX9]
MSDPGPLRLHHVGYSTKAIDVTAALYVARYGYTLITEIIHDPLQTAFVQFARLDGDSSYLEFVAPDGPGSKLTAALKRGGGLNHLCYSCGRLEDAIAELEATGMKLVSEPKPAVAFAGRRICWLVGEDPLGIELVERRDDRDLCVPGL